MKSYNIILKQNNVVKKANFNLSPDECLEKIFEYRHNPTYQGFDIEVKAIYGDGIIYVC